MSGDLKLIVLPASGENARTFTVAPKQLACLVQGDFALITAPGDRVFVAETRECIYTHADAHAAEVTEAPAKPPATEAPIPTPVVAPPTAPPTTAKELLAGLLPPAQATPTSADGLGLAELLRILDEREAGLKARLDAVSDHLLSQRLALSDAVLETRLAQERTQQTRHIAEYRDAIAPRRPSGWKASTADVAHKLAQVAHYCGERAFRATVKEGFK